MGVLADSGLISRADPALYDGCDETIADGATFDFNFYVYDGSGNPLDPTGIDVICAAWAKPGDTDPVLTFDASLSTVDGLTRLNIHASSDATRGLALGRRERNLAWSLWFDDGDDVFYLWLAADSTLTIKKG